VLGAQPPERLHAIRAAIADDVRRYADSEEFALPIVARVVSARAGAEVEGDGAKDPGRPGVTA
jgi:hypothetical protein